MKTFIGKVVSNKMNKAAVVVLEHSYKHPLYGKILTRKRKIHVADEIGVKTGDEVEIAEVKPISKTISHKITKIVNQK